MSYLPNRNFISTGNTTTSLLGANGTYTGTWENVTQWTSAAVSILGTNATDGTLWIDVRRLGSTVYSSVPFDKTDITSNAYNLPIIWNLAEDEFRVRYVNGSTAQLTEWYLETKYSISQSESLVSTTTSLIDSNTPLTLHRTVLTGETDGGGFLNVPVTQEGHMEVAIHDPLNPFGSVHVENLTPVFQTDAVYGINSGQSITTTSGSGTATGTNDLFTVSTGATIYSQAVLLGRKRLRYRAGQGVIARFTALYSVSVANSYAIAGVGTASDGVYFGYGDTNNLANTSFGILYVRGGVREIKTFTITTGATVASNVTITLNGVAFTVPVTASANIQRTVYEISTYASYTGWDAYASGATIVFVRKSAGVTLGTQSFGAGTTGAVGSGVVTKAGAASVDTFISQASWNGDKLDGTGASGITADWTKGNVFQIGIQYLGFGAITFKVEATTATTNNSTWVIVHTLKFPNTLTAPTFTNPSFPFTMAAYSAGSTTDVSVKVGSYSGFIEGAKMLHGNRFTYFNQLTTVRATNFQALFTIMNTRYYVGKANQVVINLLSLTGAIKHTSPVIFYLIKGGALSGNPNFQPLSTNSASVWDTASTTVTYSTGDKLLWTGMLGDTGEIDHHFGNGTYNAEELTLQPGEWVTLAAKSTTGSPSYVVGSINTREDQ